MKTFEQYNSKDKYVLSKELKKLLEKTADVLNKDSSRFKNISFEFGLLYDTHCIIKVPLKKGIDVYGSYLNFFEKRFRASDCISQNPNYDEGYIELKPNFNDTTLQKYLMSKDKDMKSYLEDAGFETEKKDLTGNNPDWFSACYSCDKISVEKLIENGVDINQKNRFGQTALIASLNNTQDIKFSKFLFDKGCDPSIRSTLYIGETYYGSLTKVAVNGYNIKDILMYIPYLIENNYDIKDVIRPFTPNSVGGIKNSTNGVSYGLVTKAYFITRHDDVIWESEEVQEAILKYQPYNVEFYLQHTDNSEGGYNFSEKLKNKYEHIFDSLDLGLL